MNETKMTAFGGAVHVETSDNQTNESMTLDQFLNTVLGPKQLEGPLLIPVTVFYVLVFLTGLAGNISVCVVISRNRGLHSAMNYYLISLAVADLSILLLGLPNELSIYWHQYPFPFGETFCKLRSFISETSSYASVLTIMAFSLERYIAICRPLHALPLSDAGRVAAVSCLCWGAAMVFSLPHLIFTKLNYLDYPWGSGNIVPESAFCALLDDNIYPKWYPVHEISFIMFFLVPVMLLTYLYTCMALVIRQSARAELRRSVHRESNGAPTDHRTQIIRMLIAVVVVFFISWAPFHIQRLGYVYFKESPSFRTVNEHLFYLSGCLYFLGSTLNPVIYNLISAKYRDAFKLTFCMGKVAVDRPKVPSWITQTSTTTILSAASNNYRRTSHHDALHTCPNQTNKIPLLNTRSASFDFDLPRSTRDRLGKLSSKDSNSKFETVVEEKEDTSL